MYGAKFQIGEWITFKISKETLKYIRSSLSVIDMWRAEEIYSSVKGVPFKIEESTWEVLPSGKMDIMYKCSGKDRHMKIPESLAEFVKGPDKVSTKNTEIKFEAGEYIKFQNSRDARAFFEMELKDVYWNFTGADRTFDKETEKLYKVVGTRVFRLANGDLNVFYEVEDQETGYIDYVPVQFAEFAY